MNRLLILYILLLTQCNRAVNNKEAFLSKFGDSCFIHLTGKREYSAHDPGSVVKGETYQDSLVLKASFTGKNTIKGEEITVPPGHYKFKGTLVIKNSLLIVSLFYDNYDDKKLEPLSWNGSYILRK